MKAYIFFLIGLLGFACNSTTKKAENYETRDYLEVAEILQNNPTDHFPFVINLKAGKKHLIFIGSAHTREITQQADSIDYYFHLLQPQVAFNEGGQLSKDQHYSGRDEAIRADAEIGQLKYLCDKQNIDLLNGDLLTEGEFKELFKMHEKEEVLLYTACERFFNLYKNNWIDTTMGIEKAYQKEFIQYLESEKVVLSAKEKEYSYMTKAYKKFFGKDLDVHHIPVEKYDFLKDEGRLTEIGRSSKEVRDKHLLKTIEQALMKYDRVFVAFGGAHAKAIEPALIQIMKRYE
jgi:hypothetical protein